METRDYYDMAVGRQNASIQRTWFGQRTLHRVGEIGFIREFIPVFDRLPFTFNGNQNEYYDMIVSKVQSSGSVLAPVAIVSRNYVLIQHQDLIEELDKAFRSIGIDINYLPGELTLSDYGERMYLRFVLPDFDFDPGDGYPLALELSCINSVDKSAALELSMRWYRVVCANGMMFGLGESKLRRLHLRSLTSGDIADFINEQFRAVGADKKLFKHWLKVTIQVQDLKGWVDTGLTKAWGSYLAARFYSIALVGEDGDIKDPFYKGPSSERELNNYCKVPGSQAPVKNLFHVAQALSWLAKERNTIQDTLQKVMEIPDLIQDLGDNLGISSQLYPDA